MPKNRLFTLAGLLAVLAVAGTFHAEPVVAQVRAILVQSIDEPGQNPFALTASPQTFGSWVVPAGKRYVIETVSAACDVDDTGYLTGVTLQATTGGVLVYVYVPTPANYLDANGFVSGQRVNRWSASASTHVYADGGTNLFVTTQSNFNQTGAVVRDCLFSVTGHAVNTR
jgi:hypothetical protein